MTIGAAGVKVYQNLKNAQIVNASLTADCQLVSWLQWESHLSYSYGQESTGARLPLIAPTVIAEVNTERHPQQAMLSGT